MKRAASLRSIGMSDAGGIAAGTVGPHGHTPDHRPG